MILLVLGISLGIHSTGWQVQEPARVTVKENVQSPQQVALNLKQTSWGQNNLQSENTYYECGGCNQECCINQYRYRYCTEPNAVCEDVGDSLQIWKCICYGDTTLQCGHLGEPCCSFPNEGCVGTLQCVGGICNYPGCGGLGEPCCINNACHGSLECINNRCRYTGSNYGTCGNLYRDINGPLEGGKIYVVDQSLNLDTIYKKLPAVLLVHGMGGDCSAWSDYVNWFRGRYYRIGNVSLYPQEWPHREDCSSSYTLFCPNGKMLKTLVDEYDTLLSILYPEEQGWNNSIVAVAHSRGGLDIENAVAFQNLQNISGIISLATPWWGSTLANLCLNSAPFALLCPYFCGFNFECMAMCLEATSGLIGHICTSMNPDALILNTHIMPHYRQVFSLPNIPYFGGIGYDDDWLCRNFTGNYDIGCFLIRYFTGNYINDGAVNGSSVYAMQWNYGNRFNIFSKYSSSGNPYTGWRFPDPQEWRVDHSRVIHSYDIFRQVEDITRLLFTSGGSTNSSPGVDSQAIARIADRARTVESKGYIQFLLPGDTIRVLIGGQSGISGMAIISTARLQSNAPREDLSETCDTCIIRSRIQVHSTSPQTIWVTSSDSGLVLFGFQEDTSIHFRLMRDRLIYLEGQTANLVLSLPSSVQEFEAYYSDNSIGGSNNAKVLKFRKVKPGVYAASIPNLRSGYYSVLVQVNGRTYKRTLMMNFMVIDENDPLYELVSTTNIPYGGRSKFGGERKKESSEKTLIIHGGELHVSQLELPAKKDETRYYIYNLSGKLIRAGVLSGKSINLRELNPGVYILKVSGRNYKILIK